MTSSRATRTATVLRLEGALIVAFAVFSYHLLQASWLWFLLLLLVPDVFMVGYVWGNRVGATVYNVGHTSLLRPGGSGDGYGDDGAPPRGGHLDRAHRDGPDAGLRPEGPHRLQGHPPPARLTSAARGSDQRVAPTRAEEVALGRSACRCHGKGPVGQIELNEDGPDDGRVGEEPERNGARRGQREDPHLATTRRADHPLAPDPGSPFRPSSGPARYSRSMGSNRSS